MILYDKIAAQLPEWRERVRRLTKEHGEVVVDKVTVGQVYGGMRDVKVLVTDISYVDPAEGIRFRGYSIPEVLSLLPKPDGADMPYVGGLYYLLLTGEIPNKAQAEEVEAEWRNRASIPSYVYDVLRAMPPETHPMTLFSQGILALQVGSKFAQKYHQGMKKDEYWMPALEDSLDLTAKLPILGAFIYRLKYRDGTEPRWDASLDYGANFAPDDPGGEPERICGAGAALFHLAFGSRIGECFGAYHASGRIGAFGSLPVFLGGDEWAGRAAAWAGESGMPGVAAGCDPEIRRRADP
jgi:citrate synthase